MISKELKNSLITFFSDLINNENSVDINRQVLSESADFDAHQIFNYLLSGNDNNITVNDIIKYLNSNNIQVSEQDAKMLIFFYDINSDGKLSFDEFLNFIRSEKSSLNNKLFRINDTKISFSINFSLCKLFKKEIEVSKRIIYLLKELKNKKDFNLHKIYHTLKINTFITAQSIKNFLSENNIAFLDSEVNLLMKRLDLNKDGKIDFCEFHGFLCLDTCKYNCLIDNKCPNCGSSYCRECLIDRHGCVLQNKLNNNRNHNRNNAENENTNILKNEEIIENDNNRNNQNINSTQKENSIEIKELNDYIKFLLKGENKIENIKINLCKISDFSVEDAFRIFEKNGRGYLDRDDIKYGLSTLNIYPSEYNIDLFLRRYDLQKKGFISYEDFYDIIVPFEKEFRQNMNKRLPKSTCPQSDLGREIYIMLNKLFKFLLDFENKANIEKKSLNIDFKDVFNELDTEKQGFFTFENFLDYLNGYELIEENINPDLLYIRLDKNRNGIIDLEEFAAEMIPL